MVEIDDRDFLDLIYAEWTKTTGADTHFWMPEQVAPGVDGFHIYAVDQDQKRIAVTDESGLTEVDADFITAIHGCLPDLVRRLHEAIDEADRADTEKDDAVVRIAELEIDADRDLAVIVRLEERVSELEAKLSDERGYSSYLQCDVNDANAELDAANLEVAKLEMNADLVDRTMREKDAVIVALKDKLETANANVEFWRSR